LSAVLFWQISATICVCLSITFFLSSFDHETFEDVATVVYALYVVFLSWNLNQKGWFTIMLMLTLLIELCEFCMKEVFKCREWRVMRWDEIWTKAQAWGFPCHPKKYPRGTSIKAWGCPRATPS
jgi:hypothetical protein